MVLYGEVIKYTKVEEVVDIYYKKYSIEMMKVYADTPFINHKIVQISVRNADLMLVLNWLNILNNLFDSDKYDEYIALMEKFETIIRVTYDKHKGEYNEIFSELGINISEELK